jgi:hypothetical protein
MKNPKSVLRMALLLFFLIGPFQVDAHANMVFEGNDFGNYWITEDCIEVSSSGMTITCPPAQEFAIGCYASIGDALYNVPTGVRVEIEFDGYAWLGIFDNCGRVFEFQPQPNYDYTTFSAWFQCAGQNDWVGQTASWAEEQQTWTFELLNFSDQSGHDIRQLTTWAPNGEVFVDELTMPDYYPLMGEISFYFGAGRGHSTTIKRVEFIGDDVVSDSAVSLGTIKALYR